MSRAERRTMVMRAHPALRLSRHTVTVSLRMGLSRIVAIPVSSPPRKGRGGGDQS